MANLDAKKKYTFDFDEKGTMEVSEQIRDSYHSGFIDQRTDQNDVINSAVVNDKDVR